MDQQKIPQKLLENQNPHRFSDTGRRKTNEDFIQQTKCRDMAKHSIEDSRKDAKVGSQGTNSKEDK